MARRLFSSQYWLDAGERALRAGAAASLAVIGADQIGILDIAWGTVSSVAAGTAVISLLASVVAGGFGDPSTAGFTTRAR